MRKVTLLLGIWCLICVIINPFVFWEMLFNNLLHTSDDFRYNNAVEIIGGTIFFTAFTVSPIFLIYQTVLRLMQKSHYKFFRIVKITYFFLLLNVVFYSFIYYIFTILRHPHRLFFILFHMFSY